MERIRLNILISVFLCISSVVSAQNIVRINTDQSKVKWTGKKPGGEHHGFVKLKDGQLVIVGNEVKGGSFTIDMNSITDIDLKNEEFNNKLVNHLKSSDFFDVSKHPEAKFVITDVSKINNGAKVERKATHSITGDLTIKGITKKISFDASINSLNGKVTSSTPVFSLNRTEWGVNHQSKSVFANLKDNFIHDDILLSVELISD